jgi:hypothetical protein
MNALDIRVERYLAAVPGAIAGQRGHDQTFKVACALVNGFGLEEDEALRWMRAYNGKCQPNGARRIEAQGRRCAAGQLPKAPGNLIGGGRRADQRGEASEEKALARATKGPRCSKSILLYEGIMSQPYVPYEIVLLAYA